MRPHEIALTITVLSLLGLYLYYLIGKKAAKKDKAKRLENGRQLVLKFTRLQTDRGGWWLSSGIANKYVHGEPWQDMDTMDKYVLTLLILEAENEPTE
jgi:hypothetical protein